MLVSHINKLYNSHQEKSLFGRYIHTENIKPLLENHAGKFEISEVGKSVNNEPIFNIKFGNGNKRILMWSQMHGNESTTTKAIFDLLNVIGSNEKSTQHILENCTICIIPILNPDGAKAYTRLNANKIDLNRDAQDLSQPESKVLRHVFETFKPDFCLNLHGQRTIFGAGDSNKPATLSFLSPSEDKERSVTSTRKKAMEIIVAINTMLQQEIPNQISRYDDGFNANCVGDTFQSLNIPTVLFEAGHYKDDYSRETTRKFIFTALLKTLSYIANTTVSGDFYTDYFKIPENRKNFYDIIIRNATIDDILQDVAIQYKEVLKDDKVVFKPVVEKIDDLNSYYSHKDINAKGNTVLTIDKKPVFCGYENDFVLINNELFSLI